jgi:hypothetical protein
LRADEHSWITQPYKKHTPWLGSNDRQLEIQFLSMPPLSALSSLGCTESVQEQCAQADNNAYRPADFHPIVINDSGIMHSVFLNYHAGVGCTVQRLHATCI